MDFNYDTETITPDSTNILTIGGTGGVELSVGTTAERPVSPIEGIIRYNSSLTTIEGFVNSSWVSLIGVTAVSGTTNQISVSTVSGDATISVPSTFIAPGSLQYTTNFGYPIESVAAAGNTQATATSITVTTALVTSGAAASGVILPTGAFNGQIHAVTNNTANVIYVYPNVGTSVDDGAINSPAFINAGLASTFVWDGIHWVTIQSSVSAGNSGITVDHDQGNVLISNNGVLSFSGGSTGLTPVSTTTGAVVLGGTLSVSNGGTGAGSPTIAFNNLAPTNIAGDLIYYNGANNIRLSIGSNTQVLSVSGNTPTWINQSAINAGTAVTATAAINLAGGAVGSIPYQTGSGTTTFLSIGTSSQVLIGGTSPSYVSVPTALGYTPLNKAGDTMTGTLNMGTHFITNVIDPVNMQDAATKAYVDSIVGGLLWREPVEIANLASDTGAVPGSPSNADAHIIDTGENIGAWSSFDVGDVVQIQDSVWVLIKPAAIGDRYGISFPTATTPSGSFTGLNDYIVTITGGTPGSWTYSSEAPVGNWAIYVQNANAYLYGVGYTYSTDLNEWVQFSSTTSYNAGTGLSLNGRTFNNTGVLSVTTSTGLSTNTSATGNVTVTNTGVTSIIAGSGISVSGATGAVTISSTAISPSTSVKTANYTMVNSDYTIFADGTAGGFTVTLPSSPSTGQMHNVKKIDELRTAIIINGSGNNIDKYSTVTMDVPFTSIVVQWNPTSSRWQII